MTCINHAGASQQSALRGIALWRLNDLVLSNDCHVFDNKTGRSYHINQSGQIALQLARQGQSEEDIVSQLATRFSQPAAVVAAVTEAFFSQLKKALP